MVCLYCFNHNAALHRGEVPGCSQNERFSPTVSPLMRQPIEQTQRAPCISAKKSIFASFFIMRHFLITQSQVLFLSGQRLRQRGEHRHGQDGKKSAQRNQLGTAHRIPVEPGGKQRGHPRGRRAGKDHARDIYQAIQAEGEKRRQHDGGNDKQLNGGSKVEIPAQKSLF